MKSLFSRAVLYGLLVILGLLSALPNVLPEATQQHLPGWYSQNRLSLGLDLRGGSHLLMEVDTHELLLAKNQQFADELTTLLREHRIHFNKLEPSREGIALELRSSGDQAEVKTLVRQLLTSAEQSSAYHFKQQGNHISLQSTSTFQDGVIDDALKRSLEVVRRRLDESGMVEPSITRQGRDGILVQLPGVDNPQQIRQLLGTTAKMSFHWAAATPPGAAIPVIKMRDAQNGDQYLLEKRTALEGKHISDAQLAFNPDTGQPVVNFKLDSAGGRQFGAMTRENVGRQLAVVLDGQVITAPVIRSVIAGGSGEISGYFTAQEASKLALLLRSGALPAPLKVIEERTVGPDLGSDSIAMGISTGVLGAMLVLGFMLIVYGRWGLIACFGLTLNIGLLFGALSLLGATLTLPGIAGIILSLGMAVDTNILINERIREEARKGISALSALNAGFNKAYGTIVDSNLTTLIAVSLLFLFGSGPVRGFAVTIGLGLVTSLFTAISITRLIMEWRVRRMGRQPLLISGIKGLDRLSQRPLNLMRGRFFGLCASVLLSLLAIVLFVQPGLKYGIDFSGGTVVQVQAPDTTVEQLRTRLHSDGLEQLAIQQIGDEGEYLIRLPMADAEQVASGEQVVALKNSVLKISSAASFPRVEIVGPKVSDNFADATILAILIAGLGVLLYLWVRFEYHFALAATLTIALDLTKTIGFFALVGIEFNLTAVAALLALIGYSINDKVVVFDRVRENLRLTPDKPLLTVLNESITSTLTRTVFTSLTTFLALLPMAIWGGSAVSSFAQPMLFGIVIGTSSSILIASPILYLLGQRRLRKGLAQLGPSREELQKELDRMP